LSTGDRLGDAAYDALRRSIVRGEIASGAVLAEAKVAQRLGVSKTPVREALRRLREEGLLEVGPKRQLVVAGSLKNTESRYA
jgi:DNA-binding GntR family transcriptional regulator